MIFLVTLPTCLVMHFREKGTIPTKIGVSIILFLDKSRPWKKRHMTVAEAVANKTQTKKKTFPPRGPPHSHYMPPVPVCSMQMQTQVQVPQVRKLPMRTTGSIPRPKQADPLPLTKPRGRLTFRSLACHGAFGACAADRESFCSARPC